MSKFVLGFTIFIFLLVGLSSCKKDKAVSLGGAGSFPNESIKVQGISRKFRLEVSESLNLNQPNAIIFAFHGLGIDSKDLMFSYSKLSEAAKKMNAIIVFPASEDDSWGLNFSQTLKDIAFYDDLLAKLKNHYKIDNNKIHVIGMSNGAYFCHLLGKERSETIASVTAHSGMIGLEFILGINAKRKYPVLMIHGSKDPIFSIQTARNDSKKYVNENHNCKLIEVNDLGHEWASKININDSIVNFMIENSLK